MMSMAQTKMMTLTAFTSKAPEKKKTSKTKKVVQERWVCDICRIASFLTYDEAVEHEMHCKPITVSTEGDKPPSKASTKPSSRRKQTRRKQKPKVPNSSSNNSGSLAPIFQSAPPLKQKNSNKQKSTVKTPSNAIKNKPISNNGNNNNKPLASIFTASCSKNNAAKSSSTIQNSMKRKLQTKTNSIQVDLSMEDVIPVSSTTAKPATSIWPVIASNQRKRPRINKTVKLDTWGSHELPHIIPNNNNSISSPKYSRLDMMPPFKDACSDMHYSHGLTFLEQQHMEDKKENVQWHLEQLLTPPRRTRQRKNKNSSNVCSQMWVNKYNENINVHEKIIQFVQEERSFCPQDLFDDEETRTRLLLVTGPTASGKTNMVHAAAKACKCVLMEINTTEPRGSTKLKRRVQDTSTCHSMVYACNADNNDHSNLPSDDDDDDAYIMEKKKNITLILIDEVDLMFEQNGDAGFWSTLGSLVKKAQCPIVLTAQTVPTQMAQWDYKHVHLEMPSSVDCAGKMTQIIRHEKLKWKLPDSEKLKELAQLCHYDIRRLCHELQLFACSSTYTKSTNINDNQTFSFGTSPLQHVNLPLAEVTTITPYEVSSSEYTAVTIRGENFGSRARVFVGNQKCSTVKVIDATTILAIIPPCKNSSTVNPITGYYLNSVKKAWTSHYQPLTITFSDRPTVLKSKNIDNDNNFYIHYQFQPVECQLELIREKSSDDENTFEGDIVCHPQEEKKTSFESSTYTPPPTPRQVTVERQNSLEVESGILARAIKSCAIEQVDMPTPKYDISKKEVDLMSKLAKDLEYASDVTFYQDYSSNFGCPTLGGPVPGFGTDLIDKNEFRSSNEKPPSLEQMIKNGWNDSSCVFGTSDAYMTFPTPIRDRQLLAQKSCEVSYVNNEEEEGTELLQEESFCPRSSPLLLTIPQHYQQSLKLLRSRRKDRVRKLYSLATPLLGYSPKMYSICFGLKMNHAQNDVWCENQSLDSRLALDYLPCLRRIAEIEESNDVQFKKVLAESSSKDLQSSRRRTRRFQKLERDHYFDALISSSRQWHNGREICKEICEEYLL